MAELSPDRIGLAPQLAEAEEIVRGTKAKLHAAEAGGRTPTAEQRNKLAKREAIVLTLKKIILRESPLN